MSLIRTGNPARSDPIDRFPEGLRRTSGGRPLESVITISIRSRIWGTAAHIIPAIRDSVRRHDYHVVCNPDITLGNRTLHVLLDQMEEAPAKSAYVYLASSASMAICSTLCSWLHPRVDFVIRQIGAGTLVPAPPLPPSRCAPTLSSYLARDVPDLHDRLLHVFSQFTYSSSLGGFDDRFFMYLEDLEHLASLASDCCEPVLTP